MSVLDCHLQRRFWIYPEIFHVLNEGQRERSRGRERREGQEETGEKRVGACRVKTGDEWVECEGKRKREENLTVLLLVM